MQRPKTQRPTQRLGLFGVELTPPLRSFAGQLCPVSARSSRNHTRARPSGRNRRPACAHGRERKEAPKIEIKPFVLLRLFTFPTHPSGNFFIPFATLRSQQRCPAAASLPFRSTRRQPWEQRSFRWQFTASRRYLGTVIYIRYPL